MIPKRIERLPELGSEKALTPEGSSIKKRAVLWLTTTLVFASIGFVLVLVAGIHQFGSAASALAYVRGDRLVPDAYSKSFGTVTKEERPSVDFLLRNWSEQPIKVLGVSQSCTCLATSDLPIVIPAHGEAILRVSSRAKSGLGPYSERLRIFTDSGQSSFILGIQGIFR